MFEIKHNYEINQKNLAQPRHVQVHCRHETVQTIRNNTPLLKTLGVNLNNPRNNKTQTTWNNLKVWTHTQNNQNNLKHSKNNRDNSNET